MPKKKQTTENGNASEQALVHTKRKNKPRGKPFPKGNKLGAPRFTANLPDGTPTDLRINRSGRAVLLGQSFKNWLETDSVEHPELTNAEVVACSVGTLAILGNIAAVTELRKATEGDKTTLSGGLELTANTIDIIIHDDTAGPATAGPETFNDADANAAP